MHSGNKKDVLAAKRKIGFLKTFEKKIQGLRREFERLQRAAADPKIFGNRWPTGGLERITRGLVNTAVLNDLQEITTWCRLFQKDLESIKSSVEAPTGSSFSKLATQIQQLQELHASALAEAESVIDAVQRVVPDTSSASQVPPAQPAGVLQSRGPANAAPRRGRTTVALALGSPQLCSQVETVLKRIDFEVYNVSADDGEPMARIGELSPDLIVVDMEDESPLGEALVETATLDPLTDFIPVLKLTSNKSTSPGWVRKPVVGHHLTREARQLVGADSDALSLADNFKNTTLASLVSFATSTLEQGVLDAAVGSNSDVAFDVVDEAPVIASVWDLISCLRAAATAGSAGQLRFAPPAQGRLGVMALAEAEGVLDPQRFDGVEADYLGRLAGLNVVVADDDSEICLAFERVLSDAGMRVRTAGDGVKALKLAKSNPPDLLITDILMPKMDGWELYNHLRYDFALKHIPIIVLSWKRDFLQRVKELNVAADGFMLKETDRQQILQQVSRVLKPRFALAHQLEAGGDVFGRIERVGVLTLLAEAIRLRPHCRITLRENWNFFEVDIADGEVHAVTRTSSDGVFESGEPALAILLGVSGGRFAVVSPCMNVRNMFPEGTIAAIEKATAHLNQLVAHVVGGALLHIDRIKLDTTLLALYTKICPTKFRELLRRLQQGESPRQIILNQGSSADVLAVLLLDLIHRGAVKQIVSTPSYVPSGDPIDSWHIAKDDEQPLIASVVEREKADPDERSSTITLTLDDISEIENTAARRTTVGVGEATGGISRPSGTVWMWQWAAGIFFVAFVSLLFLHFGRSTPSPVSVVSQAPSTVTPSRRLPDPPVAVDSAPSAEAWTERSTAAVDRPSIAEPPTEDTAIGEEMNERATEPLPETKRRRPRRRKKPAVRQAAPDKTSTANVDKTLSNDKIEASGMLVVKALPDAVGPIRVSIDGKLRGRTPLKVRLSPGLHELVFSREGKRTMRMVTIRADATKNITAKVPN